MDGALYYVHQDHLGSTVAVSDAAAQAVGRVQYDPYGEVLTSTLPVTLTDRLFTGARFDGTIGLYQMGARWYDPALGRWLQADTIVPNPTNPQDLNRYAYVRNNPLRYTDPSGHQPEVWSWWDVVVTAFTFDIFAYTDWAGGLPRGTTARRMQAQLEEVQEATARNIGDPLNARFPVLRTITEVSQTPEVQMGLMAAMMTANTPPEGTPRDYPLGFESRRLFHRLAKQLKRAAGVQDAIVGVTGSSTSGVSYKTGEPFGPASDIDFFIVSDELAAQVPRRFVRPNELIDMGATLYFDELRRFEELATQELGRKVTVRIYSSTGYQLRAKPTDIIVP